MKHTTRDIIYRLMQDNSFESQRRLRIMLREDPFARFVYRDERIKKSR